ncbi:MAG: sugar ABC transporter permease [Nitrosomonadales bacterium]|nr:MAG: sugar ABC transporter permease [Nitrosomonadales bacterium]
MNPHATFSTSLLVLARSVWRHRDLTLQLARREVLGRYRGSFLGLAWSFFYPLIMLTVYTFVFSVVFKAKWGVETEGGHSNFAVVLFAGMLVHGVLAEVLVRAPGTVLQNTNYVKRVIFPLEILPITNVMAAAFHMLISVGVLLPAILFLGGKWHITMLALPLVLLPLVILSLGVAWFLGAVGVFVRDVGQVMNVFTTILLFVSPVFFPLSAIPERFQFFVLLNPLTFIIEQARAVLLFGQWPDMTGLAIYSVFSVLAMWLGFLVFQKMRKGFADVL